MNINLWEDETNNYVSIYGSFLQAVQDINNKVMNDFNEIMKQSKYDKLQNLISHIIDAYTETITGDIKTDVFNNWEESEGSLRACLRRFRAGEAADETCKDIEQHMKDMMLETLKISKSDFVITERPIVSEDGLERLEDICRNAQIEIDDLKSDYITKVDSKSDENDIYGTLRPLVEGVSVNIETFFEISLQYFIKLHEFVQENSLKLHNIAEENGIVVGTGTSADQGSAKGLAGNANVTANTLENSVQEAIAKNPELLDGNIDQRLEAFCEVTIEIEGLLSKNDYTNEDYEVSRIMECYKFALDKIGNFLKVTVDFGKDGRELEWDKNSKWQGGKKFIKEFIKTKGEAGPEGHLKKPYEQETTIEIDETSSKDFYCHKDAIESLYKDINEKKPNLSFSKWSRYSDYIKVCEKLKRNPNYAGKYFFVISDILAKNVKLTEYSSTWLRQDPKDNINIVIGEAIATFDEFGRRLANNTKDFPLWWEVYASPKSFENANNYPQNISDIDKTYFSKARLILEKYNRIFSHQQEHEERLISDFNNTITNAGTTIKELSGDINKFATNNNVKIVAGSVENFLDLVIKFFTIDKPYDAAKAIAPDEKYYVFEAIEYIINYIENGYNIKLNYEGLDKPTKYNIKLKKLRKYLDNQFGEQRSLHENWSFIIDYCLYKNNGEFKFEDGSSTKKEYGCLESLMKKEYTYNEITDLTTAFLIAQKIGGKDIPQDELISNTNSIVRDFGGKYISQ